MGRDNRYLRLPSPIAAGASLVGMITLAESGWHRRAALSIPIRIHVTGSRGTSSVTRLIAAGLRAGGVRAFAKTSGKLPRWIDSEGTETTVPPRTGFRALEQSGAVRTAARQHVDALVVESIGAQSALQSVCEQKLIRATHTVITNVDAASTATRRTTKSVTLTDAAAMIPVGGQLYTAEQKRLGPLYNVAMDRQSEVTSIDDDEIAKVGWDELDQFAYVEHPENVALALRVCQDLGVDRDTALRGMQQAVPDSSVLTIYAGDCASGEHVFINGFAISDTNSTASLWETIRARYGDRRKCLAVVNCRGDRADRSRALAELIGRACPADHYVVIGTGTDEFREQAVACGLDPQQITCLEDASASRVIAALETLAGNASAVVLGMGTLAGLGQTLVQHFREHHQRRVAQSAASAGTDTEYAAAFLRKAA